MMGLDLYIKENDAFVFEFDHVLFPEKDFLLQVYYLFAQFMEYTGHLDGKKIVEFMQQIYFKEGEEGVFDKTANKFNLDAKYRLNFDLLHKKAKLPLKLLLFENCMYFLNAIVAEKKPIFLVVSGDPETQMNKLKQIEWHGLDSYLTVYFSKEIQSGQINEVLIYLIDQRNLSGRNILLTNYVDYGTKFELNAKINLFRADKLLSLKLRTL